MAFIGKPADRLLMAGFVFEASGGDHVPRLAAVALARKSGVALAVLLVSLVFALLHYSPHQLLLVTLVSFLFSLFACALALRNGTLIWSVMGWHAGWNWLLATGFELPVTGIVRTCRRCWWRCTLGVDSLTGGADGPEGSYLCSVFFIVGIACMTWRRAKTGVKSTFQRSAGSG
ncbi:MAG: CPBP family intramembrane glutamic endopeptidase [Lysobacterales bacterium]